jgi:delta 1-pyrroline-5-carboxylate dehydrogenase
LKASFTAHARVEDLLRDPEEIGAMWGRKFGLKEHTPPPPAGDRLGEPVLGAFANEPPTDFTRPENRERFRAALGEVLGQLGRSYPLVLGGEDIAPAETFASYDPGDSARAIGWFPRTTPGDARRALAVARDALAGWSSTPAQDRAAVLVRAAALFRRRKFTLAAWEVYECAKPWHEADGDVAEAIDFCEFYAREMIRLAAGWHRDVPGETNANAPFARGSRW